ncbi:MAG: hypothetical protein EZS28_005310 [Streblomastix strix]|uniref:Uncharacterized protein n=1 Tax=Streblomastix strix TaxID=222440 RepID=A0A5J4WVX9_9EUKA|nr:MAG: hypothetical protein EZS28_005310 [Streblomastix strix]
MQTAELYLLRLELNMLVEQAARTEASQFAQIPPFSARHSKPLLQECEVVHNTTSYLIHIRKRGFPTIAPDPLLSGDKYGLTTGDPAEKQTKCYLKNVKWVRREPARETPHKQMVCKHITTSYVAAECLNEYTCFPFIPITFSISSNFSEITFYINSGFAQILSLLICKCGGERDSTYVKIKETIKAIVECYNRFLYIDDQQKAIKAMDEQLELEGVIEEVESIVLLKDQELKKEALSFKKEIQKIYKKGRWNN